MNILKEKLVVFALVAILSINIYNVVLNYSHTNESLTIKNNDFYVNNFTIYYGDIVNNTIINELNKYDLVILQHWAFSKQNLTEIKGIKIAYLDLGEYDNSTYPNCTINLTGIIIGYDTQWNQYIVNVSSYKWINYTICRIKYDLSIGFNGIMFDDLDIVEQYPWEASGFIHLISLVREDFPNIYIGVNRGFELINNISNYVNFVIYEDFGTYYNFTTESYQFMNESELNYSKQIIDNIKSMGLKVLGLGYAPQSCDYYVYFDNKLGKIMGVPVYIGNWNLSIIYNPCNYIEFNYENFNSYFSMINNQAKYILSSQLNDGAIETFPSSNYIIPYISNIASIGLIKAYEITGNASYIEGAKKWLSWYSEHQNKNIDDEGIVGTIYDYEIINGTEIPTYNYDSSDSYAATYLIAFNDYIQASNNLTFLHENIKSILLSLNAIFSTMNNNLTFAKPDYDVKYLMDNCEVYKGLISSSNLIKLIGNDSYALKLMKIATAIRENIISYFLINNSYFTWALNAQVNFSDYYPDIMANYWPVIMNVIAWNSTISRNVFNLLFNESYYEDSLNLSIMDLSSAYYSTLMGESNITQIILNEEMSMNQSTYNLNVEESSWIIQSFFLYNPMNSTIIKKINTYIINHYLVLNFSILKNGNGSILIFIPSGLNYSKNYQNLTEYKIGNDEYLNLNISGNENFSISFYLGNGYLYRVEFIEVNLPYNTSWSISIENLTETSKNSTIVFYEQNGIYFYNISSSCFFSEPSSGKIIVNNQNITLTIYFNSIQNYSVIFIESGLQKGSIWFVNLTNGQSFKSKTNQLIFSEKNGSYSYEIKGPPGYYPIRENGSFTVNGKNVTELVLFEKTKNIVNDNFYSAFLLLIIVILIIIIIKFKIKY
ncbi:MAG: hypothetical protein ACP5LA_02770 [Thermoplasmata archaeon]